MVQRKLSELEGCVLGIVWAHGPCTAYFIRTVFLDSPSPYWSGSAGAIYPLVERLQASGLISSKEQATGRRRSRGYELAPAGRTELEGWLSSLTDFTTAVPPDPLRTRFEFLEALPKKRRTAFVTQAVAGLESHLRRAEQYCKEKRKAGDQYAYLAGLGTVKMLRARIDWLKEVGRLTAGNAENAGRSR